MKAFWKGIATVLFYTISGALLVYAATRSLDFITQTLPPDQQIIGWLGLAATSGGMIAWLLVFLYKAEGLGQKITAGLMVGVDMLGEFGLFTMDTLYQSGQSGMIAKLDPEEIQAVVLALSGLIAVNILATVAFHLVDPENSRRMREDFVRDNLEAKAMKEIEKRGDEITRQLAPTLAQQWAAEFEEKFADMTALGIGAPAQIQRREERGFRLPTFRKQINRLDPNAPLTISANMPTTCQNCGTPTDELHIIKDKALCFNCWIEVNDSPLQPVELSPRSAHPNGHNPGPGGD